jgi:monothiol glutaredoxin
MALSEGTRKRIQDLVGSDRVVLFMKGNRRMPQCGFSAQVVRILDSHLPSYTTVDVLQDSEVRQGIKDFTQWPTIPQLYVNGEFVGGCDIVSEMEQNGELEPLLSGAAG